MFTDPTIVGSFSELTDRLTAKRAPARWAAAEPDLAGLDSIDALLKAWREPATSNTTLTALIRLAAVDGGRDDDALLLLLHLLSGVFWRLVGQLGDLSEDVTGIVLSELTCQIRTYPWRSWRGSVVAALEKQTRRAVLAELRPTDRYHPERVPFLTCDGNPACPFIDASDLESNEDDVDLADFLGWATEHGADSDAVGVLVASECARCLHRSGADKLVGRARGITERTVIRRRERALAALRRLAPAYLAAIA
jgi:hypothetical protein